jgi:hypothetical protein
MNCGRCANPIEEERLSVLPNTRVCARCAKVLNPPKVKGRMQWSHKTAPVIEIMSEETFNESKKYYPRFGRGSGVHAMSKPTSSM